MNKILLLFSAAFVIGSITDSKADFTFRTFKTVTQEATFVDREIIKEDGSRETVTEVVIKTVEVDLTPNPVTAETTTEEDTKEVTLFLDEEAADELEEKIAEEEAIAESSGETVTDTFIDELVEEEVEEDDKVVDETTGEIAKEITYIEKNDDGTDKVDETGEIVTATVDDEVVEVVDVVTVERTEVEVIVVEVKEIVSAD